MNRHITRGMSALALGFGILMALLGPLHPAAAQTSGPVDVVRALAAAQNTNDSAAMRALIAPDARFVRDPGDPHGTDQSREAFIADNTGATRSQVTLSNIQQTAPDTVTADVVPSGPNVPHLAHPMLLHATITVAGGQVTRMVLVSSAQTQQDFAATLPGMPTTGAPAMSVPLLLTGALLLVLLGALVGRTALARR